MLVRIRRANQSVDTNVERIVFVCSLYALFSLPLSTLYYIDINLDNRLKFKIHNSWIFRIGCIRENSTECMLTECMSVRK